MFVYLFAAKSIQSYLFHSGKLRDVISASERLDCLIDNSKNSVLAQVLNTANLESDLLEANNSEEAIHFLRCKGGAFYAACQNDAPLQQLRSLWTLTILQLFPSLAFTDSLTEGESLKEALEGGHAELAMNYNTPNISLPIAPAIAERYQATGKVAIPLTEQAKQATITKEAKDSMLDPDTEKHRQAYQILEMRGDSDLQDRFTPEDLRGKIKYPLDLEKEFEFASSTAPSGDPRQDAVKDMALIHIDGNGIGQLLLELKRQLSTRTESEYRKGFRAFSDALNQATVKAAQKATNELYEIVTREKTANNETEISNETKITLPMRPIVLGGDDITLFCRADLALTYARTFCRKFETQSKIELELIFEEYLKESQLLPFITASGGILYHKANHSFLHCHHKVEELCNQAKALTKQVYKNAPPKVGPATLAIYRISNSSRSDIQNIIDNKKLSIRTGQQAYFVDNKIFDNETYPTGKVSTEYRSITLLEELAEFAYLKEAPVSIAKWRQMATLLGLGDISEADRLFNRSVDNCKNKETVTSFKSCLKKFVPPLTSNITDSEEMVWCWKKDDTLVSMLDDLLVFDHYRNTTSAPQGESNEEFIIATI